MFNFYQINEDSEIQIHDRLAIKSLILCQKTILTQYFNILSPNRSSQMKTIQVWDLYKSILFIIMYVLSKYIAMLDIKSKTYALNYTY